MDNPLVVLNALEANQLNAAAGGAEIGPFMNDIAQLENFDNTIRDYFGTYRELRQNTANTLRQDVDALLNELQPHYDSFEEYKNQLDDPDPQSPLRVSIETLSKKFRKLSWLLNQFKETEDALCNFLEDKENTLLVPGDPGDTTLMRSSRGTLTDPMMPTPKGWLPSWRPSWLLGGLGGIFATLALLASISLGRFAPRAPEPNE